MVNLMVLGYREAFVWVMIQHGDWDFCGTQHRSGHRCLCVELSFWCFFVTSPFKGKFIIASFLPLPIFKCVPKTNSHAPSQAWVTGWQVSELFAHVFRAGSRWAHCVWIDESQIFSIHWHTGYWRLIGFASPNGNSLPAIHFQVLCRFLGNTCNSFEWKLSPWKTLYPSAVETKYRTPGQERWEEKELQMTPAPTMKKFLP